MQQMATVVVDAYVIQSLVLRVDGTDSGYTYSQNETCTLGTVDARGSPISGAPAGAPNVNGIAGIPVNASGAPLTSVDNPACVGSFYPLLAATGGMTNQQHPNSALGIRLNNNQTWQLSMRASLTAGTSGVTIGQLKWKWDSTAASGFQGYTDFTTSNVRILTGGNINGYLYMDLGLLVLFTNGTGANQWVITITLASY